VPGPCMMGMNCGQVAQLSEIALDEELMVNLRWPDTWCH
jgi:hypothetical protein